MPSIYLFRRKTAADWTSQNPVLMDGELGLETDTGLFKFGNGSTAWTSRPYAGASVGVVPWGAITGTISAQTDLAAALAAKQATLVSATNIKTINGNSILGSGDLVISGGGGGISDGDKGDITVSGSGAVWTIDGGVVSLSKMADLATSTIIGRATAGTGAPEALTGTQATALLDAFTTTLKGLVPAPGSTSGKMLKDDGTWATPLESITIALSDLTTAITVGTGKETIRMPYAFTVTAVRAYLATAQTSGNIFTVDINEGGVSILSTKLTIDNAEKTSVTAATAAVISDANLADDAEITFDVDQVGDGTAKGLKVVLIGYRS